MRQKFLESFLQMRHGPDFEAISWFGRQEIINMLYTSITRATHELVLVSLDESEYSRKVADVLGELNCSTI